MFSNKRTNEFLLKCLRDYIEANRSNKEVDEDDIKSFKTFLANKKYNIELNCNNCSEQVIQDLIKEYFESIQDVFP